MADSKTVRYPAVLPVEVVEKLRDISDFERVPMAHLVTNAITEYVGKLEADRGKPYPKRAQSKLRTGRPLKEPEE